MTDLVLTSIGDAWVNSAKAGQNYGSVRWAQIQSSARRVFLRPELGNIAGRTVVDAYLVGRVGPGWVSQTLTVAPVVERWSPGRVTWANQPAVDTGAAVTEVVGVLSDGAVVTIDGLAPIVQAVADSDDWFGLRITTNSATAGQKFYATDSGEPSWELHVTLSDAPEQPANLRPDGGAVSGGAPILAWDFLDLGDDSTEQAESKVQVDTPTGGADPDAVAPDYDSGWVTNVDPHFDLTGEHSATGVGPHYWRVQVRDADGGQSEWSDWAEFTVTALPGLVIDSPTGPFGDPTPTVQAHLSSGTVKAWSVLVTGPDRSDVRADSGVQTGTVEWTVPERALGGGRVLREDEQGWIRVRVWDSVDRTVAVGQNVYVETWIEAEWDDDAGIDPVSQLLVRQTFAGSPQLEWSWDRSEVADDGYVIQVDGVTVARLGADDVTVDAGRYKWTDSGQVSPMRTHTLAVRAVEDNGVSEAVEFTNFRHLVPLLWVIHDEVAPVAVADTSHGRFERIDRLASYAPLKGGEVDVIYDYEGRRGDVEGTIFAGWQGDADVWAAADRLRTIATHPIRTAQLVWGAQSIRVRLRDVDVTSADDMDPRSALHMVRFGFVEVD